MVRTNCDATLDFRSIDLLLLEFIPIPLTDPCSVTETGGVERAREREMVNQVMLLVNYQVTEYEL